MVVVGLGVGGDEIKDILGCSVIQRGLPRVRRRVFECNMCGSNICNVCWSNMHGKPSEKSDYKA